MSQRLQQKKNLRGCDQHTRFISAAIEGNFATMKKLLRKGHNINTSNDAGETAFSWCCQYNRLRSAQFLYKHGADINIILEGNVTPLDIAVCWSSTTFRTWLKSVGGVRRKDFKEWDWDRQRKLKYTH